MKLLTHTQKNYRQTYYGGGHHHSLLPPHLKPGPFPPQGGGWVESRVELGVSAGERQLSHRQKQKTNNYNG